MSRRPWLLVPIAGRPGFKRWMRFTVAARPVRATNGIVFVPSSAKFGPVVAA